MASGFRHNRLRRLALAALCIAIAWPVVTVLLADIDPDDPDHVLRYRPHDGGMLARLAETRLRSAESAAQKDVAADTARTAILKAPLAGRALLILARRAIENGDIERSDTLALAAAQRNLTDPAIQARAIEALDRRRDYVNALVRADAMIRAHPMRSDEYLTYIASLLPNPDSQEFVADLLAGNPPWRPRFFRLMSTLTREPGHFLALWSAIEDRGGSVVRTDIRPALTAMIDAGDYTRAYLTWFSVLDQRTREHAVDIFDGGFEIEPSGLPFEWTVSSARGVIARRVPRPGKAGNHALRLDFLGSRVAYRHTNQILRLRPGSYRLEVDASVTNLYTEGTLVWRLTCMNRADVELARLRIPRGTARWQTLRTRFSVPARDCGAQDLRLKLIASARLDRKISGTVEFDDIRITEVERPQAGRTPDIGHRPR